MRVRLQAQVGSQYPERQQQSHSERRLPRRFTDHPGGADGYRDRGEEKERETRTPTLKAYGLFQISDEIAGERHGST
jgi:hypothetical protein